MPYTNIQWVRQFKTADEPSKTIFYNSNIIVSAGTWIDRSSFVKHAIVNGKHIYYLDKDIFIGSQESVNWRINYRVPKEIKSGKYELIYYVGTVNCILNNTCSYVQRMDPWFNNDWKRKQQLTINNATGLPITNFNMRIDLNVGTSTQQFFDKTQPDGGDIRVLNNDENVVLLMWIEIYDDTNQFVILHVDMNLTVGDNNFFVYFYNDSAISVSNFDTIVKKVLTEGDIVTGFTTFKDAQDDWSASGGFWLNDSSGGTQGIKKDVNVTDSNYGIVTWWKTRIRVESSGAELTVHPGNTNLSASNTLFGNRVSLNGTALTIYDFTQTVCESTATIGPVNNFYEVFVSRGINNTIRAYLDNAFIKSCTDTTILTTGFRPGAIHAGLTNTRVDVDFIYMRQSVSIEPIITYGSILTNTLPDISIVFPNEAGLQFNIGDIIVIDFNVTDDDINAVGMLFDLNYSISTAEGTGTVIINDGNVAFTPGLSCDSNNLFTVQECHYVWTIPNEADSFFILGLVDDGDDTDFDASDNSFIVNKLILGNVNENYNSDVNGPTFSPHTIVDINVTPDGQNDTNGFWQLKNIFAGDTNASVILLNRRTIDNFEANWFRYKRVPASDALLSLSDSNAFKGDFAIRLRVDTDLDNNVAIWTNNQFTHDINAEFNQGSDLEFYIKVSDVSQLDDINIVVGNDASNHVWLDLNQTVDANLLSGVWFKWDYDLNQAISNQVGTVDWTTLNYISIIVTEVSGASDFNVFIDDFVITPTPRPIINWQIGTSFCIDLNSNGNTCLDINTSSPAFILPLSNIGDLNKFWLFADLNLTGFTPYDLFDFDFNWGIGVVPTS